MRFSGLWGYIPLLQKYLAIEIAATQTKPASAGSIESAQADLVCIAPDFQSAGDLTKNVLSQSLAKATVSVIRNQQHPLLNHFPSFRRHPHGCLFTLHYQGIGVEVIFPSFCFFLR
jgi:hypothetical protein